MDLSTAAVLGDLLPRDGHPARAALAGRAWRPDLGGPSVIGFVPDAATLRAVDLTKRFPTLSSLCEEPDPAAALAAALASGEAEPFADVADLLANADPARRDASRPWILAPADLQAVKAAGVTFAVSMIERVIEEQARGEPARADAIRREIDALIGADLGSIRPGSADAEALKSYLVGRGAWSQYLEVGIGPFAEIFTKAQPMSAVGAGAEIGLHPASSWNNPEPEVAIAVSSRGRVVGATLANDVNLRDIEGRSALLLGKAKDNNASCALGPVLRLFDDGFGLDHVRSAEVTLTVEGADGFELSGRSSMSRISRDPLDLVSQMMGRHHQYPDGALLLLGTMFAPTKDRDAPAQGFTHHDGDVVSISAPGFGTLRNRVRSCEVCEPWTFGTGALMRNLARRGVL